MRTIDQAEFNATLEAVLCETFEFFAMPYYLEVLSNEKDFVGRVYELPEGIFNMSCVMELVNGVYAFLRPDVKTTCYAYDSLDEAKAHAAQLLEESLKRFQIA